MAEPDGDVGVSTPSDSDSDSYLTDDDLGVESDDLIHDLIHSCLHPSALTTTLPPERCPLFCCFYAEFDNIVGPTIVHQCPFNFMDQPMGISTDEIHDFLRKTFEEQAEGTDHTGASNSDGGPSNHFSKPTTITESEESIFDSTCDYIITGIELAGQIVCLSTHNVHIITRPTMIHNEERYERNSLFFSVGFVLRRSEDPQPFRSILSKLADMLYNMEVESCFLSSTTTSREASLNKSGDDPDAQRHNSHPLQPILRNLLSSLNAGECNIMLNESNAMHVKLFRAATGQTEETSLTQVPKTLSTTTNNSKNPQLTVEDHVVPILLRKDDEIQQFDWDLAISWIAGQLDGSSSVKALARLSEVDDEVMRACLGVLHHHRVVVLVDMFFYSNRYECTGKLGSDGKVMGPDLLDYCVKRKQSSTDDISERSSVVSGTADVMSASSADVQARSSSKQTPSQRSMNSSSSNPKLDERDETSNNETHHRTKLKNGILELYYSFDRTKTVAQIFAQKLQEDNTDDDDNKYWKNILQELDHRRFLTYGVIHGIIRRIHNHPLATINPNIKVGNNNLTMKRNMIVAEQMNGQTCDDALVCQFEKPIEDLIRMAKQVGNVIDLYA